MCHRDAQQAIDAAGAATSAAERSRLIGEAEQLLAGYSPFIPIATPLRWSVASQRLTGLRANGRGQHPLNRVIALPN
jgi:peptide/nickel transport system substrate-binding protein